MEFDLLPYFFAEKEGKKKKQMLFWRWKSKELIQNDLNQP